jgi:peptidoglycan/LPS O-acetylase OafA/YrhL
LFFVLSGFLVSGLIFEEYRKYGSFQPMHFLIRRGFKIYPAFYFYVFAMMLVAVANHYFFKNQLNITQKSALAELFFFQNYTKGLYFQTWSLAIEEHFYFFLTLLLFLIYRFSRLTLRWMIFICIFLLISALAGRVLSYTQPFDHYQSFYPTHLRLDALFFGVLLSYLFHFFKTAVLIYLNRFRYLIIIMSIGFIAPIFMLDETTYFMNIFGLPLLYMGFGGLLLITVGAVNIDRFYSAFLSKKGYAFISFIGVYSYSIYLWHLGIPQLIIQVIQKLLGRVVEGSFYVLVYFAASLVIGIVASKLIEMPFLKLRDRFFPKRNIESV